MSPMQLPARSQTRSYPLAWGDALIDTVITTYVPNNSNLLLTDSSYCRPWNFPAPLSDTVANQDELTYVFIPPSTALIPKGGCYLNEGDFRQPDWQHTFYGANYDRLLAIKAAYDPNHTFYATTAVGSDFWSLEPEGRLCGKKNE